MFIIDFEASSLRKTSYPIEVAWGDSKDNIKSFLLNPDIMNSWTDWNPKSYEFHGISREELCEKGADPRRVARQMVAELGGQVVYSDEPWYDTRWKNRLLGDAGFNPSFIKIRDLNAHLNRMIRSAKCSKSFDDFVCTFECSRRGRHRARADVFWLLEFAAYIEQCVSETRANEN